MKFILILLLSYPFFLQAQSNGTGSYWHITLHAGPYISGISNNLNKEMEANLFSKGTFFGYSGNSGRMIYNNPVVRLALERITASSWSSKLMLSALSGHVAGFSSRYGDLRVNYSQWTASFLAGYYSRQRITRVVAGPSLHFINIQTGSFLSSEFKQNTAKAGFVIEAGLRFPAKGRIFIDINSQYQFVGKQDLGTYDFGPNGSIPMGKNRLTILLFISEQVYVSGNSFLSKLFMIYLLQYKLYSFKLSSFHSLIL
jgi:hypothetical protein